MGERSGASRGAAYKSRVVAAGERVEAAEVRAYVPSRFEVCAGAVVVGDLDKPRQGRVVQMGPARFVALLPAAAQNVLRGRDWRSREGR